MDTLTLEELELETTEFLPDRLVMGNYCKPRCNDCHDSVTVAISVSVFVGIGGGCK